MSDFASIPESPAVIFGFDQSALLPIAEAIAGESVDAFTVSVRPELQGRRGWNALVLAPTFQVRARSGRTNTVTVFVKRFVRAGIGEAEIYLDASEGVASVLAEESPDVFKEEARGSFRFDEAEERGKDRPAPCVIESFSVSRLAVRLAGEPADEEVEVGKGMRVDSGDVAIVGVMREMLTVDGQSVTVDLAIADAAPQGSRLPDAKLEAADARERAEVTQRGWS